jgi:hypothetical protein
VHRDRRAALALGDPAASRNVSRRSSTPIRNLIVTGTAPAAPTAARTIARSRFGLSGIAAPPPRRVTLRTGTAEVQVEVVDEPVADQPAHRLARVALVDA